MKNIFKKNQIIITALAVMIAVAGYLNYSGSKLGEGISPVSVDKNSVKKDAGEVSNDTALIDIESWAAEDGTLKESAGWTNIYIYPGYRFKVLDCLVTNFHLPESTLIMLVSALAGRENVLAAYKKAVEERYRFFSFGDAMFIC